MTPTPEIHLLTGAYALDALPDDERAAFEAHLDACATCAREVAQLQAAAAMLGGAASVTPPAGLRDRVLAEIDRTPQERSGGTAADELVAGRATPRWVTLGLLPAAAALVLVVIGLGVVVSDLNGRLGQVEASSSQLSEVLSATDAVTISAQGPDGSLGRVVASPARGEAVFVVEDMAPAPHEHTYELWVLDAERNATPAGVFDVDDRGRAMRMLTGDLTGAVAIGITVEPAGGSPQPSGEPVMLLEFG